MFNPLSAKAVIPTLPATGIVPSGLYFSSMTGGAAFQTAGSGDVEGGAPQAMPADAVAKPPVRKTKVAPKLKTPSSLCKWKDLNCNNCNGNYRTCPKLHKLHTNRF
jgi:hypothetical protein